jgi:hypothetical protein
MVGLADVSTSLGLLVVVGSLVVVVTLTVVASATSGVGVTNLRQQSEVDP